ncbi:hypothetical protein HaLaN_13534 [Haematococcus lacustris]|uniref:Uncharacterized protein n=1 Tax=Haematococcus lacustris TaxID=44745 RepID=A0A699Z346_HAELA|nr:hypothetical protein HaLaN_13534 [Haematococcus lacustris]
MASSQSLGCSQEHVAQLRQPPAGGPDALAHVLLGCLNAGQGRGTREAPIELSDDTGDEADADDDQDMDVMDPMSGDDAPLPAALTESPGAAGESLPLT